MVVDLPAPFGPMNPSSSPRSRRERDAAKRLDEPVAPAEHAADRSQEAGIAFGDAVRLGEMLDDDLRHRAILAIARALLRRCFGASVAGGEINASISSFVSGRNWPRDSSRSSVSVPTLVRNTRLTSAPWRSKSWRTSLPLPPLATNVYQRFAASPPPGSQLSTCRRTPRSSVPSRIDCERALFQLAFDAHAELAHEAVHGALELRRRCRRRK